MSDCGVCISADIDGFCEVYEPKLVKKSRKDHCCSECSRTIPKGSEYHYVFSVFEGDAASFHTCIACNDIASTFYCDSRTHGTLWMDIAESGFFSSLTTGCFAKLATPEGRAYLNERWQRWKGLIQ